MTRRILTALFCALALCVSSQEVRSGHAVLYLNNGNILSGTISDRSSGDMVEIITDEGRSLAYSLSEIRKIDYSSAMPSVPEKGMLKPAEGYYSSPYQADKGIWWSVETVSGYSIRLGSGDKNGGFEEVDVAGGYRFNEYLRIGLGIGGRFYYNGDNFRYHSHKWAMPVYANIRGGFMPHAERTVTPFYSLDIGASIADGFMVRPTVGIKIGARRSAFLLGLSYMGQCMRVWTLTNNATATPRRFVSFAALKLGYEF